MQAFRRGFGTFQVLQMLVARMACHFAIKYDLECILLLLYFQVIIFVTKSFFSSAFRRRTSLVPIAAARLIGIELGITMYLETRRLEISKDATHSAKANEEFFFRYLQFKSTAIHCQENFVIISSICNTMNVGWRFGESHGWARFRNTWKALIDIAYGIV